MISREAIADKPARGNPTGAAQLEARIERVVELIAQGLSRRQIWQFVTEGQNGKGETPPWEISERTLDRYIAGASARFIKLSEVNQREQVGRAIARLDYLFALTLRAQDYKTCLGITRELNKLLGAYPE